MRIKPSNIPCEACPTGKYDPPPRAATNYARGRHLCDVCHSGKQVDRRLVEGMPPSSRQTAPVSKLAEITTKSPQ